MKISFIIEKNNFFTFLGPIIDSALQREFTVECWLYNKKVNGSKDYLTPTDKDIPDFQGKVTLKRFNKKQECYNLIITSKVDFVISLNPKSSYFNENLVNCKFITIQHGLDTFVSSHFKDLLSSDIIVLNTQYWKDLSIRYYSQVSPLEFERYIDEYNRKVKLCGFPKLDAFELIDRKKIRTKWGIPSDKPVILFLPIPLSINPGFWSRFFESRNRLTQFFMLLSGSIFEDKAMMKNYFHWIIKGYNNYKLTKVISNFCKKNNAYLIVKGRKKDKVPGFISKLSDKMLYDEDWYPGTIFEAISISDLCIHFYSTAVLENVPVGTYGICIDRPSPKLSNKVLSGHKLWRTPASGINAFNFEGVNTLMSIPEAISSLADMKLSHFKFCKNSQNKYLKIFTNSQDTPASKNILNTLLAELQ